MELQTCRRFVDASLFDFTLDCPAVSYIQYYEISLAAYVCCNATPIIRPFKANELYLLLFYTIYYLYFKSKPICIFQVFLTLLSFIFTFIHIWFLFSGCVGIEPTHCLYAIYHSGHSPLLTVYRSS